MNPNYYFILLASFGGICQEVLHWFDLKNKMDTEEAKKTFKSKYYWILTLLMIIISGIGTWILFYEDNVPFSKKIPFVLGAAFPVVFKKFVEAVKKRDLGGKSVRQNPTFQEVSKQYFQ